MNLFTVTSCVPHYPDNLGGWTMNIQDKDFNWAEAAINLVVAICKVVDLAKNWNLKN